MSVHKGSCPEDASAPITARWGGGVCGVCVYVCAVACSSSACAVHVCAVCVRACVHRWETLFSSLDKDLGVLRGGPVWGRRTGRRWAHLSLGWSRFKSPMAQISDCCPRQQLSRVGCQAGSQLLGSAGKAGLRPGQRDDLFLPWEGRGAKSP